MIDLNKEISFHRKHHLLMLIIIILSFFSASCSKNNTSVNDEDKIDYSKAKNWLSIPLITKSVDVFYVYPTAWIKTDSSQSNICDIDNAMMFSGATAAFNRQASAFETVANIFCPLYRQADPFYTLSLSNEQRDEVIGEIPAGDVISAFDYYIKNFNHNRPFILLGHSQGSHTLLFLLSEYMKNHPDVYQRMIASYIIGYPVTQSYLNNNPHLSFAENADDTGVIISYNTQSENVTNNIIISDLIGLVINPISWTRNESIATTSQGLGSYMPNAHGIMTPVPQYADAQIDINKGVLICSTAIDSELVLAFGPGIYHSYDIPFYYFNLRQNAQNRIDHFTKTTYYSYSNLHLSLNHRHKH